MSASQPTIIATSIGFQLEAGGAWNFRPGPAYNGTGLIYHGTDLYEAFTEKPGALAYEIRREGDSARETALPTRVL